MSHRSLLLLLASACAPEVPDEPSYQLDIAPILAANCTRCHGQLKLNDAPEDLRLDSYASYGFADPISDDPMTDTVDETQPNLMIGVADTAGLIAQRIGDPDRPMPPRFPLEDYQIETLQRWIANGAMRGPARPGNQRPTAVLAVTPGDDGALLLQLAIDDADGDLVAGNLRARVPAIGPGGEPIVTDHILGLVRSGRQELVWRPDGPGPYPLVVRLDDGGDPRDVALGEVTP